MSRHSRVTLALGALVLAISLLLSACGGGSSSASSQSAFINTSISDPAPCSAPNGPYLHVYVTVTDVQIHNSSTGQWTDLTQGLQPTQVDLLGEASNECFLAMLGSKTELQAGSYEQIRINLADSSVSLANNHCGNAGNAPLHCVVLSSNGNPGAMHPLQLSTQDQTGIKIPSGQIAGGAFTISAGETKDLDIDFNACASIIIQGNGQYRLKPVLHAGEVGLSSAINGSLVDSMTRLPINGGNGVVLLEQQDSSGADRVIMSTTTDANGAFALCPVPTGSYDLVAVAQDKSGKFYSATVVTGVSAGTAVGMISMFATGNLPATLTGTVTTGGTNGPVSEDVSLSVLASAGSFDVTVPLAAQGLATAALNTEAGACNPPSVACADFTLAVPAATVVVGAFASSISYTQLSGPPSYLVDAQTLPFGSTLCSSATEQKSSTVAVSAGTSSPVGVLSFNGCT